MIHPSERATNFQYAIRNVVRAAEALERKGRRVIYLNIGDPQSFGFRPPDFVVEAVNRAVSEKFSGYSHSSGLLEAREAIARYATGLGSPTETKDVIVTSGASEAADLTLTALVDPGDEVLLPAPGYPIYPAIVGKLGAKIRYYHLQPEDNWHPSVDEIRLLINPGTRAIVLINPSNPAGSITPDSTTRELLALAAERDLLVISDEVYRELCFTTAPTAASVLAKETGAAVVTLESLSKTHMLSGWRIGWLRFTHPERMGGLADAVVKLAGGRLCSPTPAQYAVAPALESSRDYINNFLKEIKRRRDLATSRIASINGLSCVVPEAAFYLMVKTDNLNGRTDEQFALDLLEASGVLVVHGSGFGCNPADGYFRLVYLADEQTLDAAFDGIEQAMRMTPQESGIGAALHV
ncbi:MAG TPA: aminotransferase class I/II-fold pyridoxal phosphate-dependent enzyme [Pyrinomonadaceae bacterium]|nr:aminotransferase class I/II-fold pyridoxal phosphate-dependent enzyme [Pyrinomonadaceae bacterium]